jgi:hypothetical protein
MTAAAGSMQAGAGVDDGAAANAARSRRLQRLAAVLGFAGVLEAAGIVYFGSLGDPRFVFGLDLITFGFLGIVVLFPVMGALIAQRRPMTRVAWLMIVLGLGLGFGLLTYAYGVVGQPPARSLPLATPALVVSQLFFVPTIGATTTWILLLYPTDRLLGRRWAWAGVLSLAGAVVYSVGGLVRPGDLDPVAVPGLANPLAVEGELGWFLYSIAEAGNLVGLGGLVLGAGSLIARYRFGDMIVRAQIRWLALAAILGAATLGLSLLPMPDELRVVNDILFGLGLSFIACMPIAIGIAITRYRLYDIDRLINRALVYGSLTAILAGVFTAGVGLAQRIFVAVTNETSDAAIVGTTLVVATLYAPLRKRLEAIVDRRFKFEEARFGSYRDELTRHLALTDPGRAAERLVREAVDELDATGGAVLDAKGAVLSSAGAWPVEAAIRLPLIRAGAEAGTLVVGPRLDGRPHEDRAVAMLDEVVGLASRAMDRAPAAR